MAGDGLEHRSRTPPGPRPACRGRCPSRHLRGPAPQGSAAAGLPHDGGRVHLLLRDLLADAVVQLVGACRRGSDVRRDRTPVGGWAPSLGLPRRIRDRPISGRQSAHGGASCCHSRRDAQTPSRSPRSRGRCRGLHGDAPLDHCAAAHREPGDLDTVCWPAQGRQSTLVLHSGRGHDVVRGSRPGHRSGTHRRRSLGLLPLAALRAGPHQLRRYRHLCLGAVVAAAIAALATSTWVGGMSHVRSGVGVTPILFCLGLAAVTGHLCSLADREGNQHQLALVMLFIASTAACLFGSNLSISWQLTLMGLLLVPACIAACYIFPIPVRTSITLAVIVTLGLGSAVVAVEARFDVRRSASWSASTVPVSLGRVTVRTDAETARAFVELKQAATAAGWHQGVPLIDTTFTPAVPLALGAQVPPVLLPAFPGFATTSVCYAVQGLDAHWRNAWILMSTALTTQDRRRVTAYLGRRYPDDYVQVAEFDPPHSDLHGRLLRPRTPRAPDEPTARSGCLAPRPSR